MANKKLWYISKYANISRYGADTRQAYLCKELSKLNFDSSLITSNSSHLYRDLPKFNQSFISENYSGFQVFWINTLKYLPGSIFFRFLSWIHFEFGVLRLIFRKNIRKPDIVICSSLSILSVISGAYLKFRFGTKFIFEVRDIWPKSLVELKGLSQYHPVVLLLKMIEYIGYRYSDAIVGTMPGLEDHVASVLKSKFTNKVTYIPHGVDFCFYIEDQENINQDYIDEYLPKNKRIVMYAGSLNEAYDLDNIISLAGRFFTEDIGFVFVGDGPEYQRLKARSLHLDNVYFAPKVEKKFLLSILKHADILIHSFMKKEVFSKGVSPNKFIDYLYAGKPILCIGDIVCPMITESQAGKIVSPDNETLIDNVLEELLTMSELDKDLLAHQAKAYLKDKLSYQILARNYSGLFL